MKITHKLIIAAALVTALGIAAVAADKQAPKDRVLRIQSNGRVIAEIHLLAPCRFLCDAAKSTLHVTQGDGTYRTTGKALDCTLLFDDGSEVVDIGGNVEFAGNLVDLGVNTK